MKSKLVLVEGLPGTGKTTASKYIKDYLDSRGLQSELYSEGNYDNPADFEYVCYIPRVELLNIINKHPQLSSIVDKYSCIDNNNVTIKYGKMWSGNRELVDDNAISELSKYDIYEGLSLEDYIGLTKTKWKGFANEAENKNNITILECCFLQLIFR